MITDNGQSQLLKVVAGKAFRFADLFVVGASNAVLPTSITSLDFAWATAPIAESYVDDALGQVMFHGSLPANLAGDINEIGLISQNSDFVSTGLPVNLVYGFEQTENWFSDGEFIVTNTSSVGATNFQFVDTVAGTYLAKLANDVSINRYDTVKIRLNSINVSKVQLVLKNDELNYTWKEFNLINGSNSISSAISSFTNVGSFNPNKVTEIRMIITEVSNTTNSIEFDALTLSSNLNGGLVARTPLAVTQYKRQGASMEIEFAVALNA